MLGWLVVPLGLQALAMAVDEAYFHRRRGLPRWERIGHPLDTLTKDEAVHARLCTAGEQWLHAILFVLHPIVLAAFALLWRAGHTDILAVQLALVAGFGIYQVVYWNVIRRPADADAGADAAPATANNAFFAERAAPWYGAEDTPLALLRAESRHRNPWIADVIDRELGPGPRAVLDVGCGPGYLANALAARGHLVTGVDLGPEALAVAHRHDPTRSVDYRVGDALALPFADATFDVVCAMDLIEHVEEPDRLVAEAGRVLRPGGLMFFHTFNRTWQAHLIVIKGVEWFVRNTPKDLHVQRLFVTPDELGGMCRAHALAPVEVKGSRPRFGWPLWRMVVTGRVGDDFAFTFTPSKKLGYTGYARKAA
jgi:2-polyprenyl-6-hydroxyphenyl methylase / 3-demethylubiquinone-9 3-methyltransferase